MSERDLTTPRHVIFGRVEKGTNCRVCARDVDDGRRTYCSDYCKSIADAVSRMLNWNGVRRVIIERDDRTCQKCGFKQAWLDRGYDHLREICEERLPERPESPPISEFDEWTEEQWDNHRREYQNWSDQRKSLISEFYGLESQSLHWPAPENRLEVDHVTPISEGGHPFDPANLVTLCEDCHLEKTAAENSGPRQPRVDPQQLLLDELEVADD